MQTTGYLQHKLFPAERLAGETLHESSRYESSSPRICIHIGVDIRATKVYRGNVMICRIAMYSSGVTSVTMVLPFDIADYVALRSFAVVLNCEDLLNSIDRGC